MNVPSSKEELKKLFRDFLYNIDKFLKRNAIITTSEIEILYLQEPQEIEYKFRSLGLIKVKNYMSTFMISYHYPLNEVEIDFEFFYARITTEELLKFLDEIKNEKYS